MGKIGFGYGSEWQLLRMLGRHRVYFDDLVLREFDGIDSIAWFDFKFNGSKDDEVLGEDVFKEIEYDGVHPNILNKTNWDCVGILSDGTYLLGEAKGNLSEFSNADQTGAKEKSRRDYEELVLKIFDFYDIDRSYLGAWFKGAYQLGNRIAMQYYMEKILGKKSKVVYIFFLNDWKYHYDGVSMSGAKSVRSKDVWKEAFDKKLVKLGFDTSLKQNQVMNNIKLVFPNCSQK